MTASIIKNIARDLGVDPKQVAAAVALIDGGATVPFIARYRKEATGSLDDAQLRRLDERLTYLRDLEDRRTAVLKSIGDQGKLDPTLKPRSSRPTAKAGSKTSTCRSGRSAAREPRWPARPGWGRWRTCW